MGLVALYAINLLHLRAEEGWYELPVWLYSPGSLLIQITYLFTPSFLKRHSAYDASGLFEMFATSLIGRLSLLCNALLLGTAAAAACPLVEGLPDYNCDGKAAIVVLGDSLVSGVGDTKNGNQGGYVLRTQTRFPGASVVNQGVPGLRTETLLKNLRRAFANITTSKLGQDLLAADLVVLDLGRNDRWSFGPPAATLRNLKRLRQSIQSSVPRNGGVAPLVVTAVLMSPNRGSQSPWVKELDALIEKSHSTEYPADLRFDLVSKRLLQPDNIHPTSKGYAAMAKVFISYLLNNYPDHVAILREDLDNDGLYDMFEASKFGTDPTNPDTDGDGIKDGKDPSPAG
jgi:lysophospholipase L1-like esterase